MMQVVSLYVGLNNASSHHRGTGSNDNEQQWRVTTPETIKQPEYFKSHAEEGVTASRQAPQQQQNTQSRDCPTQATPGIGWEHSAVVRTNEQTGDPQEGRRGNVLPLQKRKVT
jgi:hypothetical protein